MAHHLPVDCVRRFVLWNRGSDIFDWTIVRLGLDRLFKRGQSARCWAFQFCNIDNCVFPSKQSSHAVSGAILWVLRRVMHVVRESLEMESRSNAIERWTIER